MRQVAHRVDRGVEAQDVRLTMGGEPTYVGIDDPESPQWNIDALGDLKRRCGMGLIQALREKNGARGLAPLRAGEMVSGRATASLGAELLLAYRRGSRMGRLRFIASKS